MMQGLRKAVWLLRLEMRLAIRSTVQYAGEGISSLLAVGAGLSYLILNLLFAMLLPPGAVTLVANPDVLVISMALLVAIFATLSATQMFQLIAMRRDSLLIHLSPFPSSVVLLIRILVVACKTALLPLFVITPILNQFIFRGQYELLGFIPTSMALSIIVSCMLTAVFSLGARTIGISGVRIVASFAGLLGVLAFGLGAVTYHAVQVFLPTNSSAGAYPSGVVWLSSAITGNLLPLCILALAAFIALTTVSATQHKLLLRVVLEQDLTHKSSIVDSGFSSNFIWALLKKEWRLLFRNPEFWFHFARIVFIILVTASFLHKTGLGAPIIAVAIVVSCCIVANDISWLMIATEQTPDLIASSPLPFSAVLRAKIIAAGILPIIMLFTTCMSYSFDNPKLSIIPSLLGLPAIFVTVALNTAMAFRKRSFQISNGIRQPALIVVAQTCSILCFGLATLLLSRIAYR